MHSFTPSQHDCSSPDVGAFLDITHGLYSLSWSDPVEWPDFVSEYSAFYRSREEWDALLASAGFTLCIQEAGEKAIRNYAQCEHSVFRRKSCTFANVIRAYYAVYKPTPGFALPPVSQPPSAVRVTATSINMKATATAANTVDAAAASASAATTGAAATAASTRASSISTDGAASHRAGMSSVTVTGQKRSIHLVNAPEASMAPATATLSSLSSLAVSSVAAPSGSDGAAPGGGAVKKNAHGNALYESTKYPGRFYKLNPTTGAAEWV